MSSDRLRQWLNLIAAFGQPAVTALAFGLGTSFDQATASDTPEPLIIPAGYAFIIWTLIYAGSFAYAVFQFLPAQRANPLFRRIGWGTAAAFAGTAAWLAFARFNLTWGTVACIVWMLASLAVVVHEFVRCPGPLTPAERWLVVFPLSVFAGWTTVATFANTAAAVKPLGWLDAGPGEVGWTVLMLTAAAGIGAAVTLAARGNVGYAGTLVWAFVAIGVADRMRGPHPEVMAAVGLGVGLVLAAAVAGWVLGRRRPHPVPVDA